MWTWISLGPRRSPVRLTLAFSLWALTVHGELSCPSAAAKQQQRSYSYIWAYPSSFHPVLRASPQQCRVKKELLRLRRSISKAALSIRVLTPILAVLDSLRNFLPSHLMRFLFTR